MPVPIKLVLGAGAVAVHLVRSRKRALADEQHVKQQRRDEPKSAIVHAFTSESSEISVPVAALRQKPNSGADFAVLVLASIVIIAAACVAAVRDQYDLVAAVAGSWVLVLLAQLLQRRSWGTTNNSSGLQDVDVQVEVVDAEPLEVPDLSGTWIKDNAASESMEDALRLMQLNGMMRTAVHMIKGVKIELDEARFYFGVFSVISWFKITERYLLEEAAQQRRRDFRRGKSTGVARITPWGSVRLEYEWNSPLAGRGVDEFKLDEQGRLVVAATIYVGNQTASYTQVYNKKK